MGRVEHYPGGTFCWVELATSDLGAVAQFYEGLLGWRLETTEVGAVARIDDLDVAAVTAEPDAARGGWRSFVAVYDPAETTRRAAELGGSALEDAVIRDPHGAELRLRPAGASAGARLVNEVGAWSWTELVTPDLAAAGWFYGELFGWTAEAAGGPIERQSWTMGDLLIAGAHSPQPGKPTHPRWEVSFRVADARAAAARAEQLGGRVLLPPMDIPIGAFTIVADPGGASLTLTEFGQVIRGVDGS